MCTQYTTNNNEFAIEFSKKQEHEHSTSRTFVTLSAQDCKKARQSRRQALVIQSVLCEVVLYVKREQLWFVDLRQTDPRNKCCCLQKGCSQRRIYNKQLLVYTLFKLETVAHINSGYNKEFNYLQHILGFYFLCNHTYIIGHYNPSVRIIDLVSQRPSFSGQLQSTNSYFKRF